MKTRVLTIMLVTLALLTMGQTDVLLFDLERFGSYYVYADSIFIGWYNGTIAASFMVPAGTDSVHIYPDPVSAIAETWHKSETMLVTTVQNPFIDVLDIHLIILRPSLTFQEARVRVFDTRGRLIDFERVGHLGSNTALVGFEFKDLPRGVVLYVHVEAKLSGHWYSESVKVLRL